ncbi:MAG: type II toxin-antitoxin system prevent-host-death family antitoxin [Actinomycetia bacterium]|nr:type II toxin-antitoxin system prevent-host-death family antitoxin [Actinomycetes bacterium]MCP3911915.1 type II toxin-antitoxin system prevent-host-death family antitoxin [Actinomycetes bacterium]MCP4087338.1 type II toxin-antitoxin system prevent-host-death family antitoxin [Actinomycetes bacterium]
MERIGIRDLRANLADYVRRAERGERVVVTVDGQPLAELGPVGGSSGAATLDELIANGLVRAPGRSRGATLPDPVEAPADTRPGAALDELRGP